MRKIKNELERYVPNSVFIEFQEAQEKLHDVQAQKNEDLQAAVKRIDSDID